MRRFALALAATLTSTALLPALPVEATYSGSSGRISFYRVVDGVGEIYSAAANGSGMVRLTDSGVDGDGNPRQSVFSDWSPGGAQIAFDSDRVDADGNQDVVQVYVMDADGGSVRQVTAGLGGVQGDPAWSPNGQRLAMEAMWGNYPADQGIWTIPSDAVMADKADAVRVTTFPYADGYDGEPQYSPDGAWIVFTRFAGCLYHPHRDKQPVGCQQAIFKVWPDGSHLTQLTSWGRQNSAPDWSPDGRQIAFDSGDVGRQGSVGDVWVMNADGSGKRRLTHTRPANRAAGFVITNNPVWSPDGTQLMYTQWHDDQPATIDRINSDGTGQTTVVTGGEFMNKVDWGVHP
jgi:TolB protein